jgi:hypothetical protein
VERLKREKTRLLKDHDETSQRLSSLEESKALLQALYDDQAYLTHPPAQSDMVLQIQLCQMASRPTSKSTSTDSIY